MYSVPGGISSRIESLNIPDAPRKSGVVHDSAGAGPFSIISLIRERQRGIATASRLLKTVLSLVTAIAYGSSVKA